MIGNSPELALDHADANLLGELLRVWAAKRPRNLERSVYYDGEAALKDFGISLPPQMRGVAAALGWSTKGVNALTDRSKFEGFVSPVGAEDPFGLDEVLYDNRFMVEFPQAKVSSAVHGCSFLTVSRGDVQSGEPDVLILARAAEDSAAIWDRRRRALKGFLSVADVDDQGNASLLVLYTPDKVATLTRGARGWSVDVQKNPLGRVTVAPLPYRAELKRPLGHSRITRASMYYADAGLRTIVRAEVSAEFYSAPEYWLFGADVSAFQGADKWTAVMGRIKALEYEEGDPKPELHRFAGASPQPHTDQLRMWQANFAEDQDLEVKFADSSNPSSADAIFAAKETLITVTRDANAAWGQGAVDAVGLAVMLRDGTTSIPAEMRRMSAQFTDPAVVSPTAQADAFVKRASAIEGFGTSEVGLEMSGLSREQIIRFKAEMARNQTGTLVERLAASAQAARAADPAVAAVAP